MFKTKIPNVKKALKLEKKGDKLVQKGNFRKGLEKYKLSEKFNPDRKEIYQKLSNALNRADIEWTENDFEDSMTWTMRQQELENPAIKKVYEKFSSEYREIQKLIQKLMLTSEEQEEGEILNQILSFGEKATLPLLDFLTSIKKIANQPLEKRTPEEQIDEGPTEEI